MNQLLLNNNSACLKKDQSSGLNDFVLHSLELDTFICNSCQADTVLVKFSFYGFYAFHSSILTPPLFSFFYWFKLLDV